MNDFNAGTEAAFVQSSTDFATLLTDLETLAAQTNIGEGVINSLRDQVLSATSQEALDEISEKIALRMKNAIQETNKKNPILLLFEGKMSAIEAFKQSGTNISGFIRQVEKVTGFASGGFVSGPGGPRSDSIPALLSNGEYVINARSTQRHKSLLEKINAEGNRYANGGAVSGAGIGSGISITVNPSPGMDERALAAAVSRRLAYEIRRGTV
jgi:hypothetical protein